MKRRRVAFSRSARNDLLLLYKAIAERSSARTALGYVERIERYCGGFDIASERGQKLERLGSNVRMVGFERSATIIFRVGANRVTVVRVFHRGADWRRTL